MTLRDIARDEVVTVDPGTPVEEVAAVMREQNIGSVIVTEDGEPVGIVTDRDLGVEIWTHEAPTEATAADVMTADLFSVDVDTHLYDALEGAREAGVRRIPLTENGNLAGIVTIDDVLVLLAGEFDQIAGVIQSESPPY